VRALLAILARAILARADAAPPAPVAPVACHVPTPAEVRCWLASVAPPVPSATRPIEASA